MIDAKERYTVNLRRPPLTDEEVRLAVVGRGNYPQRADINLVEEQLGGELDAVIALGPELAGVLGTGGWESDVPLLVMADHHDVQLTTLTGGAEAWNWGVSWGMMGLIRSPDPSDAIHAISRNPSPWQVYLLPQALWDIGTVRNDPTRGIAELRLLIGASKWRQLPLVMAAGHAAGFVSQPLSLELDRDNLFAQLAYERRIIGRAQWGRARQMQRDENISMRAALLKMGAIIEEDATLLDERLRILIERKQSENQFTGVAPSSGGIRYVQAVAGGGPIGGVPDYVAEPFYGQRICALHATNEELLFYAVPLDDYSEPLILQYDRPQGKQITQGAGWGEADPGVSYDSATAGHAAALQRLVWMPENVLEQVTDTDERMQNMMTMSFASASTWPLRQCCEYSQTIQFGLA